MISQGIFRSYDIRGIYPEELNEEAAYLIGKAFASFLKAKKIVIGRDMRLSSPALFESVCKGITDAGCDVFDLGETPTEIIYFSVGKHDYDAGIMITASHNPKEYNGLKLIKKAKNSIIIISGKEIYTELDKAKGSLKKGKTEKIDLRQEYIDYAFSLVNHEKIKPFKIVVDAGNGMAARWIPLIEKSLPIKIVPINFNIDGSFPSHPSNPLEEGVTDELGRAIVKEKADFGFIFDGDADRIFLMDEKGQAVRADTTTLFLAKYFLEKQKGATIIYNTICSKSVPDTIKKWGGKSAKSPVGFINVQKAMIKNKGIMGGELSGHYCFKDNFYADSSVMAFLIILKVLSESDKKLSELADELSLYVKSAETNFKVENKEEIIEKVKEKYSDGKQEYLDGVTVEYKDWWFNLRPSNTEPLLRLTVEAETKELLEKKQKELSEFIQ